MTHNYNGQLDTAARALETAADALAELWDSGDVRLQPGDLKRIAAYLSRVRVSSSKVRDALKLFEAIALKPDGPRLLKKAATLEEMRVIAIPPGFFKEIETPNHEENLQK